jgi:hypothetical protein
MGHPVPGRYKYGDLALQVGGVSDETVKYGREFCGTLIQEWLLWQGLVAIVQVNCRPVLSSERVPHIKKPAIVRQKTKIWSWAPDGSPAPGRTGRLTVGRKLTSTSTSTSTSQYSYDLPLVQRGGIKHSNGSISRSGQGDSAAGAAASQPRSPGTE